MIFGFFFFKQKTAYEMRISDWSSDVCSSDLLNGAETLSPLALFMQADIVVKLVLFGLLAASIWTWAIIINHSRKLRKINQETEEGEKSFWAKEDIDSVNWRAAKSEGPVARVFSAGITGWRVSVAGTVRDRGGGAGRLA